MPNTPSAKKELRKNKKRRLANRAVKSRTKTFVKKAFLAIESRSEDMADRVRMAVSMVDRAAKKRVIHPNKAARIKSRLTKLAHAAATPEDVES